jgi:hypothetical protein
MSMVASVLVIVVRWATQDRCPAAMTIEFRQTRHYATPQPLRMRPTDGLGRPLRLLDSSEWIKGCRGPLRVFADMPSQRLQVCFTPESGHGSPRPTCRRERTYRHMQIAGVL